MNLTWYHKFLMAFAFICAIAILSPKEVKDGANEAQVEHIHQD